MRAPDRQRPGNGPAHNTGGRDDPPQNSQVRALLAGTRGPHPVRGGSRPPAWEEEPAQAEPEQGQSLEGTRTPRCQRSALLWDWGVRETWGVAGHS